MNSDSKKSINDKNKGLSLSKQKSSLSGKKISHTNLTGENFNENRRFNNRDNENTAFINKDVEKKVKYKSLTPQVKRTPLNRNLRSTLRPSSTIPSRNVRNTPQKLSKPRQPISNNPKDVLSQEYPEIMSNEMKGKITEKIKQAIKNGNKSDKIELGNQDSLLSSENQSRENEVLDSGSESGNENMSEGRVSKRKKKSLGEMKANALERAKQLKKTGQNMRKLPENLSSKAHEIKKKTEAAKAYAEQMRKMDKAEIMKMAKKRMKMSKAALKQQLKARVAKIKKRIKDKLKVNAKYGKSPYMSCLFMLMMFLAAFNDIFLDLFVGLTTAIIGFLFSLTGVGAAVGAPLIALVETTGDLIDVVTGGILIIFSLITGGVTKSSFKKNIFSVFRLLTGVAIESIPIINLFTTWIVIIAINWYVVRKDATKFEESQ